jgi:fatty-acyl-CoA synthase
MTAPALYQMAFQPQLLVNALDQLPGRPTLIMEDGRVFTAGQVRDITSQYCQALAQQGLAKGSVVAILSGNRPEVVHAQHACMLDELVSVPLHPKGALDDYLYILDDSGAAAIVYDPGPFGAAVHEIKRHRPHLRLFAFGPDAEAGGDAVDLCAAADAQTPVPLVAPALDGSELFRISYTGGTTGKPKGVRGTHLYAGYCMMIQMAEWDWPEEVRMLICAPLSHIGSALFIPTLLRGGSAIVHTGFDPLAILQSIETHRITCILLVPTMIYALLDHPRFGEFDLSSLKCIYYGASSMSPARLKEGIEKLGPVFFQFYGQSEATQCVTVLRRHEHKVDDPFRMASCGRPVPWVTVALLDDAGRQVPLGEPGEICVRAPLVMTGYHNKPEQTAEALKDGWLHTGDVAVRDADGFLRIVDRKKDMIISGGFNVFPREVEDVIGTHPGVASCAVIGVPDEKWGEAVKAVVVPRPGATIDPAEIIALVREKKGVVQTPKSVDFVDAIPLTAIGKPDKKALRVRYG